MKCDFRIDSGALLDIRRLIEFLIENENIRIAIARKKNNGA